MLRILSIGIVLAITASTTRTAQAQRAPDMATLDRGDGISKFGVDLGFTSLDTPFYSSALRLELSGQYVLDSGLGFYGALPISRSFGDAPPPSPQAATALGNLELGLLFVVSSSPTVSWVFRGGVALPTADDDVDGVTTNYYAAWPRITDLALAAPNSIYGRLGISPLIHVDRVFLRLDLGLDIGDDDNDAADELVRINVGGGIDLGVVALSLELANIASLDDFDEDERFLHSLALTFRFMGEQLQPFLTIGAPLDDSTRNAVTFFVAGGIQFAP